jgi:hypothetical protein
MKRFTFKINRSTGPYRSFYPDTVDIKIDKKIVGSITTKNGHLSGHWKVSLCVKDNSPIRPSMKFRWATLAKECETIDDAKKWLLKNQEGITNKYDLYQLD